MKRGIIAFLLMILSAVNVLSQSTSNHKIGLYGGIGLNNHEADFNK